MKEFDLEKQFINKSPIYNLSETGILKLFFKERRITQEKIIKVLGCPKKSLIKWFTKGLVMPAKWIPEFEALRDRFLEWEEVHGHIFNSIEHISAYKQRPKPPTPKYEPKPKKDIEMVGGLPKFAYVPLHDCPYKKDGLNFGLDYNEYDVCDDCHLSVACLRYKKRYESKRGIK